MNHVKNPEVIIIGAGLTGLVSAFYLKKKGIHTILIERSASVGGVIQTEEKDGFIFESGPNTGIISYPEVSELFEDLRDGCHLEPANPEAKRRLILKNGTWHALPSGPLEAIQTPLFTLRDKFRILGEPFRQRGTNPNENLSDMVRRRLGKSFLDYAIDPFISGVYAGDTDYLIPRFALPKLYALEQNYGSFIRGAIQKKRTKRSERDQKATREVFSVKGGLGNLINALIDEIGRENILCNVQQAQFIPSTKGFTLTGQLNQQPLSLSAQKIVSTTGAHQLSTLFPFLAEANIATIKNLKYAKVVQVAAGFKKWKGRPLDAFGGLIPSHVNSNLLGILFPSAFLSGRAPKGGALLSIFLGGIRKPHIEQLNDNEILKILTKEVPQLMDLATFNPDTIRIFRYKHAIPQYGIDTEKRLEAIDTIEKKYPGLILAGNLRNGIGMADRIKQARDIANKLF